MFEMNIGCSSMPRGLEESLKDLCVQNYMYIYMVYQSNIVFPTWRGVLRRERHDSSRRERTGNARLCFFLLLVSFLFSSIEKSPRRRILTLASSPVPSTKLGTTTLSLSLSIVIAFLQREVVSIPYGTHFLGLFPKPSSICHVPLSPNLQASKDALPHASTKLKKTRFPGPCRGRSFDVQSAPSN
ncbi:hypothetical protein BDP67DRAFT_273314 [Colletotrichum lupini]|nr:hypothetical protein BDP67DRAFT_273314 [Colletotrichum lupini]